MFSIDHDGVIDDETGRDSQSHEREIVEAVPQQVHDAKRTHNGQRHGHAGNDGRGQVPQEKEDDHHYQGNGQHQLELHVFDRSPDGDSAVGERDYVDRSREAGLKRGQQFLNAVYNADDVRARLPLDIHDDGGNFIHPCRLQRVLRSVDYSGYVLDTDRSPILISDDNGLVGAAGQELIVRADGKGLARAIEVSLRLVDIGGSECSPQVFQAQTVCGELGRVGLHAHRRFLPSGNRHQPDAGDL